MRVEEEGGASAPITFRLDSLKEEGLPNLMSKVDFRCAQKLGLHTFS